MKILKKYSNGGKAVKGKNDKGLSKQSKKKESEIKIDRKIDKGEIKRRIGKNNFVEKNRKREFPGESKMKVRKDLVKVYENGGTPEKEGPFPKARIIKPEDKWKKESYNTSDKMKDHKGDPKQSGSKMARKRRAKRLLKKSYGPASAMGVSAEAKSKKRKYVK